MDTYRIGKPVVREEDLRMLKGRGRYVDDVTAPHQARAWVLRSPYAHAEIRSIDASAARQAPGVLAVLTGDELAERGLGTLKPTAPGKRSDGSHEASGRFATRADSGSRCRPSASKLSGASQVSKAAFACGHSRLSSENQAVSRFSPLTTAAWRNVPS